jgi:hypothetical protein
MLKTEICYKGINLIAVMFCVHNSKAAYMASQGFLHRFEIEVNLVERVLFCSLVQFFLGQLEEHRHSKSQ